MREELKHLCALERLRAEHQEDIQREQVNFDRERGSISGQNKGVVIASD